MNNPLLLLLATGTVLGLNFPLGKLAIEAGVNPVLWAAMICLGAGISTFVVARVTDAPRSEAGVARYAVTSGFLSYVVPHFLTYSAIPKIGSGLAAIMFALSPVATAMLSLIFRVRPPNPMALTGIGFGLLGALIIIFGRNTNFAGGMLWLALAALIPMFLAAGNVYRTLGWPKGQSAMRLASLTNLAAVPFLVAAAYVQAGSIDLTPFATVPAVVAAQLIVSTLLFLMLFRLQELGGPTYLSQIGYVSAIVGAGFGVAWFGETYPPSVWAGAGVVAIGIALTTVAQVRVARA